MQFIYYYLFIVLLCVRTIVIAYVYILWKTASLLVLQCFDAVGWVAGRASGL